MGINDANYKVNSGGSGARVHCPFYAKWQSMLNRCYQKNRNIVHLAYVDCEVCDEWLLFSNFKRWMEKQDWKDKELDKDILIQGNKIYSPKTRLFVPKKVNLLLNNHLSARGDCPQGVHFDKAYKKYIAQCTADGARVYLGRHDTASEASKVYRDFKYGVIKDVAMSQPEPIRSALLNYKIPTNE